MTGTAKIHKVGINLGGNDLIRAKLTTTTLITTGEIGFDGTYLKYYSGGNERTIGGSGTNALRVDELKSPTASLALNGQRIINVGTPTDPTDAATKAYVDSVSQGLDIKSSVRVATTINLVATRISNVLTATINGAIIVDDVTLIVGDRILVKEQTTGADNGIYTVTAIGDISNPFQLTRATDADITAEVTAGMFTFVTEGTVNSDTGWVLNTDDSIVLNTTSLSFTQFTGTGSITAGAGLTKTGNTLDVVSANTGIVANANDIALTLATNSGLEISSGLKLNSTISGAGLTYTTGVLDIGQGTGIIVNANDVQINTSVVARKYIDTVSIADANCNGVTTDFVITHSLSNQWVSVQIVDQNTLEDVILDVERTSTSTVTVKFASAPLNGEDYAVVVIG